LLLKLDGEIYHLKKTNSFYDKNNAFNLGDACERKKEKKYYAIN